MKKDRNSFFSQYGMSSYNQGPYMYPNNVPNINSQSSFQSQFSQGYDPNELDAKLNKIERELQRLDSRLTRVESSLSGSTINNTDYNFANSMYMV